MTNDASVEAVLKKHLRISIDQDWDGMKYAILGIDEAAAELAALSPPPTVGAEDEAVAWMHPTAGWVSVNHDTIAMHCRSPELHPQPLYTRPAPAADGQRVKAIKAALEWDERRNYIMPYRVRDPLRACLATDKEGA